MKPVRIRLPKTASHDADPVEWLVNRYCGFWCRLMDRTMPHPRTFRLVVWLSEKLTPATW
jgi:hypothetical protein